jgi:hypothetical protein
MKVNISPSTSAYMVAEDFSVKQMEYRELAKQIFPLLKSTKKRIFNTQFK